MADPATQRVAAGRAGLGFAPLSLSVRHFPTFGRKTEPAAFGRGPPTPRR